MENYRELFLGIQSVDILCHKTQSVLDDFYGPHNETDSEVQIVTNKTLSRVTFWYEIRLNFSFFYSIREALFLSHEYNNEISIQDNESQNWRSSLLPKIP